MRFPLLAVLSIVPLLNLAQASKFDSPLDAREYIDGLTTREFDDAADLQLRADILAGLSTRTIVEELKKRGHRNSKPTPPEPPGYYECQHCELAFKKHEVETTPRLIPKCTVKLSHVYIWHDGKPPNGFPI
ncbi:hypothetical protein D9611_012342 [Ephemerocybe angulata]|uniref:Uncharacterized protein n=1 Tax=Ephemerocybe angulata TaxID=980116 RepID=A0A8H5CFY7_9AGAR|nr:hypothetical protein D9611_012342 [Tulosesus angulatus]